MELDSVGQLRLRISQDLEKHGLKIVGSKKSKLTLDFMVRVYELIDRHFKIEVATIKKSNLEKSTYYITSDMLNELIDLKQDEIQ